MQNLILYIAVAFIYLMVAADYWRYTRNTQGKAAKSATATQTLTLHSAMIALALALHGWLLFNGLFGNGFNELLLREMPIVLEAIEAGVTLQS